MKNIEDFKKQAKEKNITKWNIHNCSMCGYTCGYIIYNEDHVAYDNGCNCIWGGERPSNWDEIAMHYNSNFNYANDPKNTTPDLTKKYVEEMNKFWGFI